MTVDFGRKKHVGSPTQLNTLPIRSPMFETTENPKGPKEVDQAVVASTCNNRENTFTLWL